MSQVSPSGPRQQNVVSRVPKDINTWTHVFVRNDGIPSQLRPPYSGPYKVIKREPKYFVLDIGGKRNTVSIDRLKKAFIEEDLHSVPSFPQTDSATPANTTDSAQPRHTKSGRTVRWPARFVQVFRNSKGNVNEEEIQKLNCGNSKIDEDITSEGTKSEKPKIPEKEPDSVLFKPGTEKEFDQHSLGSVPEDVSKSEAVEIVINDTQPKKLADTNTIKDRFKAGLRQMWNDFQKAYKNQRNLMWSFWWVVVVCGKTHIGNYIQSLYEDIVPNPMSDMSYNAAIDAAALATCAASSFGVGFLKIEWNSYENVLLFSVNVIISCLMIVMALATKIWLAYMCYIIIRISYHTVLTIATYQIATFLDTQSYALVFGFNTFLALVLETTLTIIVVDKRGLNLDIRTQFIVYGGYFGVLALPFLARMLYCFFVKRRSMAFKNENT
ncbi:folate transporter 1-like isoform X1 [Octopus vulgaris]|uniref:Folate transporter 1-like isoform X1 n=1 Tax=Octopus vulgaris TaxID=6645 RepID=A0AA36F9B9_OCTVU|nr:folate transporter 1-like isoform X1 [Octopus vulgaris]